MSKEGQEWRAEGRAGPGGNLPDQHRDFCAAPCWDETLLGRSGQKTDRVGVVLAEALSVVLRMDCEEEAGSPKQATPGVQLGGTGSEGWWCRTVLGYHLEWGTGRIRRWISGGL